MIPPGLAYVAASERAWKRMDTTNQPRYYFDLRKEHKSNAKGEASYTPSVALIAAMGASLDYFATLGGGDVAEGRRLLVDNAERCAAMTRAAVQALGLKEGGVDFAVDQWNQGVLTPEAKAAADAAKADIISGKIEVHDYMSDSKCPN